MQILSLAYTKFKTEVDDIFVHVHITLKKNIGIENNRQSSFLPSVINDIFMACSVQSLSVMLQIGNTTRRCRTKKIIARSWSNLVNEPEG